MKPEGMKTRLQEILDATPQDLDGRDVDTTWASMSVRDILITQEVWKMVAELCVRLDSIDDELNNIANRDVS